ncbi:radical SAM/SPASM domain-containing protein [Mesorhizobium sp. BR1-1-14]|uniref:radical SAM/SPASM domain-containing protein n=1 Tax=Mesorhizobium sp. BR1-1-14 TaxID=2876655 RepID=UPI001CD0A280|nr:SPASM domain-containing protein [Mesorhizobium sp. BR1-1-14]MBZ9959319.1 SPASM domain-containing protein [Mesorhizobium sp. BR1-1-14]
MSDGHAKSELGSPPNHGQNLPPRFHLFDGSAGYGVLVVDGSRVHRLSESVADLLTFAVSNGRPEIVDQVFDAVGFSRDLVVGAEAPVAIPVRAFSLAIAQKCNLGCTYCYADGGDFGGKPSLMADDVATAAIHRLFDGVLPGEALKLAFLGGEPLTNRAGLRRATELATELATARDINIGFSLTTNGTLLTAQDAEFLARYRFTVTVSLDGVGATHDKLRPYKGGHGSFERIVARLAPLLARQDQIDLAARVTVTPRNLSLVDTLNGLVALGFRSVGFSPMLSSPTGREEMSRDELSTMLDQLIACGRSFEESVRAGRHHAFSNLATALRELHRGTHRPYPCGAGAGYLGVSAEGNLSACHRFVNEPVGAFGDLASGVDRKKQETWLAERHVDRQEPCRSCWARYLCGGGCHHEVIHRGRPACDYIRDWLTYCLGAYLRLADDCPWWFAGEPPSIRS